jgi:tetratricopeptide (TPR) repeat protein
MLAHEYVPANVWRAVCHAIDLRNNPVKMSNIYNAGVVHNILNRMSERDPLRYAYIPPSCTEENIKYIIDTAKDVQVYLERGQIYLAETAISGIRQYCPTHPDILDIQKRYAEVRSTGAVDTVKTAKESPHNDKYENMASLNDKERMGDAIKQLENAINEDYKRYNAYYPLGSLYLKNGDVQKADYIAELLLDLGQDNTHACMLKGHILEYKGQIEEAFFYYEEACQYDGGNNEAADDRKRLLKHFEPNFEEETVKTKSVKRKPHYIDNESDMVIETVKATDELIKRGRLTEAYYELAKKSEEYSQSDLLKFKKAMAIYLMRKEPEARDVFCSIKEDSLLYERAGFLIKDIDFNIVNNRKYVGISNVTLADIFFNTGKYEDALNIYNKTDENEMTAHMWTQKGRCELETGKLNAALRSLINALKKDPAAGHVRELIGLIYQAKGENDHALEMYDDALKLSFNNLNVCELKASLLYSMGKNEDILKFRKTMESKSLGYSDVDGYAGLVYAHGVPENRKKGLVYLERAIMAGSSNVEFYMAAADICIAEAQYFRAFINIEKGLSATENSDELYMKKSEILYLSGKLDAAYINAGIILTGKPQSAETQYLVGCIHSDKGEKREAVKWFKSAADIEPENHKYAYAVADHSFEIGNMTEALLYYTKAVAIDGNDYVSLKRRAVIYNMNDEKKKAVEDIQYAAVLQPEDPEIYLIIGDILSSHDVENNLDLEGSTVNEADKSDEEENESENDKSEDKEKKDAEYYYTKALDLDPSYLQGYINRARYYTDNRRLDDALNDIETAVNIDGDADDVYMMRGIIHHVRGENADAVKDFQRVSSAAKFALQAFSYIAKCCNAMGKYNDAVEAANKGIALNSEFLNLYVNRGVALFHLEKYHQAIEDFKKVIQKKNEINTAAVEAAYRFRGMTNERLGDMKAAYNDYRMLLKYNPDYSDIKIKVEEMKEMFDVNEKKPRFSLFRKKKHTED